MIYSNHVETSETGICQQDNKAKYCRRKLLIISTVPGVLKTKTMTTKPSRMHFLPTLLLIRLSKTKKGELAKLQSREGMISRGRCRSGVGVEFVGSIILNLMYRIIGKAEGKPTPPSFRKRRRNREAERERERATTTALLPTTDYLLPPVFLLLPFMIFLPFPRSHHPNHITFGLRLSSQQHFNFISEIPYIHVSHPLAFLQSPCVKPSRLSPVTTCILRQD